MPPVGGVHIQILYIIKAKVTCELCWVPFCELQSYEPQGKRVPSPRKNKETAFFSVTDYSVCENQLIKSLLKIN